MLQKIDQASIDAIRLSLEEKNWDKTLHIACPLLEIFPGNLFLLVSIHKAYVQLSDFEKAFTFIDKVLEINNQVPAYHYLKGQLLQKMGLLDQAKLSLVKAIKLTDTVASYHACLGGIEFNQENYASALICYSKAIELDGTNISWLNRLARSASKTGDFNKAIDTYEKSLQIKNDFTVLAAQLELKRQLASPGYKVKQVNEAASAEYYDDIFHNHQSMLSTAKIPLIFPCGKKSLNI
jgi:tetratricopeptide (TPR) repeat protein